MHVLGEIIRVMEMDHTLLMRLHNIRRKQETLRDILAHFPCHIIPLYAVDGRIFIGIFLFYLLVIALQKA